MKRSLTLTLISLMVLWIAACRTQTETIATPDASPISSPVAATPPEEPTALISEVLAGVDGNNNYDFIELANPSQAAPFNLQGWSLWYQLSENDRAVKVYGWKEPALIPPQGHYLLVFEGQDVGLEADAVFDVGMIPQRGGLQLRRQNQTVGDSLAWGDGPAEYGEGVLAAAMKNGAALERLPGGGQGNWLDTDDNSADFVASAPNPQNAASPRTPALEPGLALSVDAPRSVVPGETFSYQLQVTNEGSEAIQGVSLQLPIAALGEIAQTPAEVTVGDQDGFWGMTGLGDSSQVITWLVGDLEPGASAATQFDVTAPWTYTDLVAANYSAQGVGGVAAVFGSPVHTAVEGGAVPVGVLPDLVGQTLVVEGVASMYTGGYYAGGGNVKFYLADESGGVQVWVPGGEGTVNIHLGDRVRVKGDLQVYRGALELVVNDLADAEVVKRNEPVPDWVLMAVSLGQAANDPSLAGKLVQVSGTVARNEEFSYSYELDLIDDSGQLLTLYVDKQTNINVEAIESGQQFYATGILEMYDTRLQLYPRIQADLERIYPPVLTLELGAPNTVLPGDELEVILTATNYLPDILTNLVITATLPAQGVSFVSASNEAQIHGSRLVWYIPELAGGGSAARVSYRVKAMETVDFLVFDAYSAGAQNWPEAVGGDPYYVFLGESVPIWAIQGAGDRSPYTFDPVVTAGTVTGVFPELGGFWIQEMDSDQDPLTSAGIFINTGEFEVAVDSGNRVRVSGIVRETYQQTQVGISNSQDVVVLEQGGPLPAAVALDSPGDQSESDRYYESLEGMLVQVDGGWVVVGPTSQYGEYVLVPPDREIERLWQGDSQHNGLAIMVDDGSSAVHQERSTMATVVNSGDRISGLVGPLAYTYGRYKIEPVVQPRIEPVAVNLPTLALTTSDEFRLMTWNTENLFDLFDPHPSDPPKPSIQGYKTDIAKVANTILAAGAPTIVALQEVENIGILEDIAGQEVLQEFQYQAILLEGSDSRYIDNGYLVRGDVARVVDVQQHVAPEGLTSRPPLQIEIEMQGATSPLRFFVINNHFTSMSGGEAATEPRRAAQAAWNVMVLEAIQADNPDAMVAILGDLNSYTQSLPVDTLRAAGLVHIFDMDPQAGWYSYIYQGVSQTLDHILVTPSLFDLLQRVDILHVNADYALPEVTDESPLHKSDHDPVIATFSLP